MEKAVGEIKFLGRSQTRIRILEALSDNSELAQDEIRQRLDVSRTTVQRNLEALVERGYISETNRTYSLTTCKQYITDDLFYFVEIIETVDRLEPFLQWIEPAALDIDLRYLRDADLFLPKDGDPYSMVNRHVALLQEAECAYALLPLTGLHASKIAHGRATNHDAEMELVVESDVAETHLSDPQYRELTEDLTDVDHYRMFRYDGSIPVGLAIIDDTVQILADNGNEPRAMIETDDDRVQNWAEQRFREYRDQATKIV